MTLRPLRALALVLALGSLSPVVGSDAEPALDKQVTIFGNYADAYRAAQAERRMLVIYFQAENATSPDAFESQVLMEPQIREKLKDFVVAKISTSAAGMVEGKTIRFLDHPAFAEMHRRPGVAIIDLSNPQSPHYGHVVSIYPFKSGRRLSQHHFAEMLQLPPGTLTQRTLVFAVRIHPERPASASGRWNAILASESESHSRHQAEIGVQGHHNWDYRFQRINGKLAGTTAQEVCAESWPGQDLLDAAIECVDSWRQSPGHWSAVRSRSLFFGYDMKRGRNGIWYGTGIFARR